MSSNNKENSLLNEIFLESKSNPKNLLPILQSSEKIVNIFQFLNDNKNQLKEKINFLSSLMSLFNENNYLIPFLIDRCYLKGYNLFEPLINMYLDKNISKEDLIKIEEIIKLFIINVTIPKSVLEYIYQRLSIFFGKAEENDNKEILTEDLLIRYLNILELFYGEQIPKDLEQNEMIDDDIDNKPRMNTIINKRGKTTHISNYKVKNYFYFNGKDSILNFKLNKSSSNVNSDFPTLEYGFSFIFWINLRKELFENYLNYFPSTIITLINIDIVGHKIKLILKNTYSLEVLLDDKEVGKIELKETKFQFDEWNFICFYLTQKIRGKSPSIKLIINDNKELLSIILPDDFPLNEIINSISLFENLFGNVTSVLFFSFCLDIKVIDYLRSNITKGFFKNKYLFNFLYQNERDYFKNIQNYKYCNKYKKEKSSLKLLNINLRNQNVKNLMVFFCPFTYNKKENYIDDIFGHFRAIPGKNDGVNLYENNSKSILQLGGINNLLPIAELMFYNESKSKNISYPLIDKKILTESSFYEYLNVLKKIFINHHDNLLEAYNKNFFSKLGLFFEKFPSNIYTEKILDILLEIGKEAFLFSTDNTNENNENFLSIILLNEKIISKFNIQNQLKLWDILYQFFTSDYSQMKGSINMAKICLLLRFYDENRYNEYCCLYHANFFKPNNNSNYNPVIMNPEMNDKLAKLFDIIQLYIDKISIYEEEEVNLFKLLSLDLSPCMQKKIIKAYILHFENKSISKDDKLNTIKNLFKNNFFDIFEYTFSISLLDIRIELINLLDIILKDYNNSLNLFITQNRVPTDMKIIYEFIGDNILPEQLIVEIENNNDKIDKISNINNLYDSKIEFLSKYFNRKEYENQIEILWKLLTNSIIKKGSDLTTSKSSKIEFSELYINFCINLVSKNIVTDYIYDFLILIQENLKKKDILNLYIFYEKDYFYSWLIETIFYFNNKENTKDTSKKDLYEKIRTNSITIFQEIFSKIKNEKNKINKIQFILNFSYKLKILAKNNKSKLNEIESMTRYLLKLLLDNNNVNIELLIISCYELIIFHKYSEKYIGEINKIENDEHAMSKEIIKVDNNNIKRNFTTRLFESNNENFKIDENYSDNKNNVVEILNIKIDYSNLIEKEEVIPDCVYDSLYYFGDNNLNNKGKPNRKDEPLYKIWKDFPFYEKIINFYSNNIWGLDKLCQTIKEDPKKNSKDLYQKLLKEYGDNKSYKNKLYKDLLKLLDINDNINKDEYPINILNINIQLLSIALNLSNESKEKEKIEKNIHQLLIYCIISSINININEKYYDCIQDKLYDIIGFSFLLLKKSNPDLFKDIIDNLITPIFEQVNNEQNKKGFMKLFSKKNIYGNTCIFRLFNYGGKSLGDEKNNLRGSTMLYSKMTLDPKQESPLTETKNIKDDFNLDKLSNELLSFKGDILKLLMHGFQYSLIYFKNQRLKIKLDELKTFYKYILNSNKLENNDIINNTKERKRINKSIKKLIPFFESQIKKYSNTSFLSEKNRRNDYKSTKGMLFSWCGFWSNRHLFLEHPEMLKLKRRNHLTKEMTEILMKPILDINYYLPNFTKFEKKNLFNENNNYSYQINLDIDDILLDETQLENKNKKNSFNPKKNSDGFNYLECIYKYSYDEIWDKYKSYYEQNLNIETMGLLSKVSYDILISNKEISKDIEKLRIENIYYCCMVKLTHHIKGYISTEENKIIFIYESDEYNTKFILENDPGYDKDMDSCFGSIFKGHQKDKDKINFEIKYNNIKYMFIKMYFYNLSAIEIYTESNKSYLFTFKTNKDLSQFTNDVLNHAEFRPIKINDIKNKIIGYEKVNPLENKKIDYFIFSKYEEWRNYSISTLELLMWLNIYSGRSFNDITQYPVFPWILNNYNSEDLKEETDIRDLSSPMGMLELNEKSLTRKETFIEIYESVKNDLNELDSEFNYQEYLKNGEEYYNNYLQKKFKMKNEKKEESEEIAYIQPNQLPYFFGTHYSNPTYVSHYLTRIFPYSLIAIEIQGEKFDDPDRLFTSMKKTFESATSLKDDVRELIPEFYTLPEMFENINNLNLTQDKKNAESDITIINDVELPPWSMNSSYNFVAQLRKSLENEKTSINKWLDLIFGVNQKGEKAEELHNLFMGNSYQGNVKIESFEDADTRNTLLRLFEVGITPLQLFDNECKSKIEIDNKSKIFYESKNFSIKYIKSSKYKRICEHFYYNNNSSSNKDYKINIYPRIIKMKCLNNDLIKVFTNTNLYFNIKLTKVDEKITSEESELCEIENQSSKFSPSYFISHIDIPIIIYNKNRTMIKGGFWDGRIEISSIIFEDKLSTCIFPNDEDPVLAMKMTKNENYLLCGTKKGFIIIYSVLGQNFTKIHKILNHNDEITSISINDNLNMFATSSKDGCIMLYILPSFKLVRTIKLSLNEDKNEFIFGDNVFLSSCPIPCICIYISSKKVFRTYSINGAKLHENNELENSTYIKSSNIIHNYNFQEFLIYGTNNGFIKIRKFPDMSLVKTFEFLDGKPIEAFALSKDHSFCYAYSGGDNFAIISVEETKDNEENKAI